VQAAAVVFPIVVAVVVSVDEVVSRLSGSCTLESCARAGPLLVIGAVFVFGGPIWWATSGASRASRLRRRQLAWLLAVNVYLVMVGLVFWAQARAHGNQMAPLSEAVLVFVACALVSTAVLSAVVCTGRIVEIRRGLDN
jgi:hypothetical protein